MSFLLDGLMAVTWQQIVMYVVGIILIWLQSKRSTSPRCCCLWALVRFW